MMVVDCRLELQHVVFHDPDSHRTTHRTLSARGFPGRLGIDANDEETEPTDQAVQSPERAQRPAPDSRLKPLEHDNGPEYDQTGAGDEDDRPHEDVDG